MKYAGVRDQIRSGDILLFRGGMLHSKLIRLWTRSVYSHVGIATRIRSAHTERLAVIEALEGRGVQIYPLSEYLERGNHVDWFAIEDETVDRDCVVEWAYKCWGRDYASPLQFLRSFAIITKAICDRLGMPTKLDRDRYFCSWFAAQALRAGGWEPDKLDDKPPEQCTPGEVALFPCLRRRGTLEL